MRIENLRKLAEYAGSMTKLAKLLGLSKEFMDSVAGFNPTRTLEDRTARDIEFCLDLPQGYLDQEH